MATTATPRTAEAAAGGLTTARRSAVTASWVAFKALLLRDLTVLRKKLDEFLPRTLLQPFLLVFVFTYVFPKIGQGVGGGTGPAAESAFATLLVAGVVGITILFQGIQSVALPMVQEFGYTKEIEDRVLAPLPVSLVALGKVTSGAIQGLIAALIVFPIAAVVPANDVHLEVQLARGAHAGAVGVHHGVGARAHVRDPVPAPHRADDVRRHHHPDHVPRLRLLLLDRTGADQVCGFSWLQSLVLVNPLVYMSEGFRARLHYGRPHVARGGVLALAGFAALFLYLGINGFKKRVLS